MKILNNTELGIQSWSFRGLNGNVAIVEALKQCNVKALEISGIHVNPDNAVDVLRLYSEEGITLTGIGVNRIKNDEAESAVYFKLASKLGIKIMSIDPDPDALELTEKLCCEYGVKTAIHNHGRKHRYGTRKQLEEIFTKTSGNIGLFLDTAWALDAGEDPVKMVRQYESRLYGIHFKDFVFDSDSKPHEVITGTGALDLPGIMKALREIGYDGVASVEYEEDKDDPVPNIKKCVEAITAIEATQSNKTITTI